MKRYTAWARVESFSSPSLINCFLSEQPKIFLIFWRVTINKLVVLWTSLFTLTRWSIGYNNLLAVYNVCLIDSLTRKLLLSERKIKSNRKSLDAMCFSSNSLFFDQRNVCDDDNSVLNGTKLTFWADFKFKLLDLTFNLDICDFSLWIFRVSMLK